MSFPSVVHVRGLAIGADHPLAIIAGPCVIESEAVTFTIAETLKHWCNQHRLSFVFKASFDKTNRTSIHSFRGPGLVEGLSILQRVKAYLSVPVTTDIHEPWQAEQAAAVCDMLQIPALLCRQTNLLLAAGSTGKAVNLKKGQGMSTEQLSYAASKVATPCGNCNVLATERGTTFGYGDLIVDFRNIQIIRNEVGLPAALDVTHSLQTYRKGDSRSLGQPQYRTTLAKAGVAAGVDALFVEVHPQPTEARSDGAVALALNEFPAFLEAISPFAELRKRSS